MARPVRCNGLFGDRDATRVFGNPRRGLLNGSHLFAGPHHVDISGAGLIQQGLESKQDGALEQHRVEMNDHARQQDPQCAPRVSGEKCDGGQEGVDGKADAVGSATASRSQYPER